MYDLRTVVLVTVVLTWVTWGQNDEATLYERQELAGVRHLATEENCTEEVTCRDCVELLSGRSSIYAHMNFAIGDCTASSSEIDDSHNCSNALDGRWTEDDLPWTAKEGEISSWMQIQFIHNITLVMGRLLLHNYSCDDIELTLQFSDDSNAEALALPTKFNDGEETWYLFNIVPSLSDGVNITFSSSVCRYNKTSILEIELFYLPENIEKMQNSMFSDVEQRPKTDTVVALDGIYRIEPRNPPSTTSPPTRSNGNENGHYLRATFNETQTVVLIRIFYATCKSPPAVRSQPPDKSQLEVTLEGELESHTYLESVKDNSIADVDWIVLQTNRSRIKQVRVEISPSSCLKISRGLIELDIYIDSGNQTDVAAANSTTLTCSGNRINCTKMVDESMMSTAGWEVPSTNISNVDTAIGAWVSMEFGQTYELTVLKLMQGFCDCVKDLRLEFSEGTCQQVKLQEPLGDHITDELGKDWNIFRLNNVVTDSINITVISLYQVAKAKPTFVEIELYGIETELTTPTSKPTTTEFTTVYHETKGTTMTRRLSTLETTIKTTVPSLPSTYVGSCKITNQKFDEALTDRNSLEYKALYNRTYGPLLDGLRAGSSGRLLEITEITFTKGSVNMNFKFNLAGESPLNTIKVVNSLTNSFNKSGLVIDPTSFDFYNVLSSTIAITPAGTAGSGDVPPTRDPLVNLLAGLLGGVLVVLLVTIGCVIVTVRAYQRKRREHVEEETFSYNSHPSLFAFPQPVQHHRDTGRTDNPQTFFNRMPISRQLYTNNRSRRPWDPFNGDEASSRISNGRLQPRNRNPNTAAVMVNPSRRGNTGRDERRARGTPSSGTNGRRTTESAATRSQNIDSRHGRVPSYDFGEDEALSLYYRADPDYDESNWNMFSFMSSSFPRRSRPDPYHRRPPPWMQPYPHNRIQFENRQMESNI